MVKSACLSNIANKVCFETRCLFTPFELAPVSSSKLHGFGFMGLLTTIYQAVYLQHIIVVSTILPGILINTLNTRNRLSQCTVVILHICHVSYTRPMARLNKSLMLTVAFHFRDLTT